MLFQTQVIAVVVLANAGNFDRITTDPTKILKI